MRARPRWAGIRDQPRERAGPVVTVGRDRRAARLRRLAHRSPSRASSSPAGDRPATGGGRRHAQPLVAEGQDDAGAQVAADLELLAGQRAGHHADVDLVEVRGSPRP